MARTTRLETLVLTLRQGFVPLFHHDDVDTAMRILHALQDGGARVIEFTHRGDGARDVFAALERHLRGSGSRVVLGVGSVTDAPTAAAYVDAGAAFVVSPSMHDDVALLCNRRRIPFVPGAATPTEVSHAEARGAEIVKVFPGGAAGGPDLVRAILGPSPRSRLMPTGGVQPTAASLSSWFDAGAACVGLGSALVRSSDVAEGAWDAITARTREVVALVAQERAPLREEWV